MLLFLRLYWYFMKDLCDNGNSQFLKPTFQFLQGMNEFVEINTTEKKNSVQQVLFKSKKFFYRSLLLKALVLYLVILSDYVVEYSLEKDLCWVRGGEWNFVAQPEWKLSEEWLKSYLSSGGYKSAGVWKQAGGCCWPPDNMSPVTLAKIFTFGP